MTLLITGITLWIVIHLFPSVCKQCRAGIVNKIGLMPYRGLFALLIVSSVVLIVLGWRAMTPEQIYNPPTWGRHITYLLVLLAFILFAAARKNTNIHRFLRHPQLAGLVIWSIGHLLSNGDNRSIILFTTLGIWAVVEMKVINMREGPWNKPDPLPVKKDAMTVVAGCLIYAVLFYAHPYFTGMKLA